MSPWKLTFLLSHSTNRCYAMVWFNFYITSFELYKVKPEVNLFQFTHKWAATWESIVPKSKLKQNGFTVFLSVEN